MGKLPRGGFCFVFKEEASLSKEGGGGTWAEVVETFIDLNYFLSAYKEWSLMPSTGDSAVSRAPALLELTFWLGERR